MNVVYRPTEALVGTFDESSDDAAAGRVAEAAARLNTDGIDVVRLGYPDLIGTERGRDLLVHHFPRTVADGVAFCRSVYGTTPMGDVVDVEGGLSAGLPDVLAVPDVSTLLAVPWEPGVAHCIADVINPDGSPSEESPRAVLKRVLEQFAGLGMQPIVGPELEFFLLEPEGAGWKRYGEATGNVYVSGRKGDPENVLLRMLRQLSEYGLDVVAANHEFASGQFEINLWHSGALEAADRAFRFKTAIKELARLDGKLATFMAKPFNDEGGSGFHVHFSTQGDDGTALFDDPQGQFGLSDTARSAIAGILAHAPALAAILNPTINSYKRFGPDTLAPWLIDWGLDNRSAMIRIPPERGHASRLELRLGDATANPYLAIAAVLAAAHLGIKDGLQPPEPLTGYGYDPAKADRLPADLAGALDALEADDALAGVLGKPFVTMFLTYKRDELERFSRFVTDWEFREYAYHL
jgi:glutamine synthetase